MNMSAPVMSMYKSCLDLECSTILPKALPIKHKQIIATIRWRCRRLSEWLSVSRNLFYVLLPLLANALIRTLCMVFSL